MVVIKKDIYNSIIQDIRCYIGLSRNCKEMLIEKYPEIPAFTLGSIISNQWRIKMRNSYRKAPHINERYYNMYQMCKENGEPPGILIKLSIELEISPSLLASSILQHIHAVSKESSKQTKHELKDPTLIKDRDLAFEIHMCNISDNEYGKFANVIKHSVGKEYEHRLEHELKMLNIAFIDEAILRNKGYDKTPDFKLIIPIAVDGFVINWIECKALFGDESTHAGYLKDQLLCYWNRFGPGLVIYWFGYVDTIEATPENNSMIILRDSFPDVSSITFMDPDSIDV